MDAARVAEFEIGVMRVILGDPGDRRHQGCGFEIAGCGEDGVDRAEDDPPVADAVELCEFLGCDLGVVHGPSEAVTPAL
jgi:hypothetical protein